MDANLLFIYPMKPVKVGLSIFDTIDPNNYYMESKYDGWRCIVVINSQPSLWTRVKTKIDMPINLYEQILSLKLPEGTVLDGEIWTPTKRGSWRHNQNVICNLTLWDAIRSGPNNLSSLPLTQRRLELEKLIGSGTNEIKLTEVLPATKEVYLGVERSAKEHKALGQCHSGFIHGTVLKRRESPRRDHSIASKEHSDWLKLVIPGMQSGEK